MINRVIFNKKIKKSTVFRSLVLFSFCCDFLRTSRLVTPAPTDCCRAECQRRRPSRARARARRSACRPCRCRCRQTVRASIRRLLLRRHVAASFSASNVVAQRVRCVQCACQLTASAGSSAAANAAASLSFANFSAFSFLISCCVLDFLAPGCGFGLLAVDNHETQS